MYKKIALLFLIFSTTSENIASIQNLAELSLALEKLSTINNNKIKYESLESFFAELTADIAEAIKTKNLISLEKYDTNIVIDSIKFTLSILFSDPEFINPDYNKTRQ